MEKYDFRSTLLIPDPVCSGGRNYRFVDTLKGTADNGNREYVDVLIFNATSKDGIKPMLEREIKRLQTLEKPTEVDVHNMAYLENLLRELEDGCYEHETPEALLTIVNRCTGRNFTSNELIYLSGITDVRM